MTDAAINTATSIRQRRSQAAHLLSTAVRRESIDWTDLLALPDWALTTAEIDQLAWMTGACLYADQLRRSIDGRVLDLLRARLGQPSFDALMSGPINTTERRYVTHSPPLQRLMPDELDRFLAHVGRDCLLASVASSRVRDQLRSVWWPGSTPVLERQELADAIAAVRQALGYQDATATAIKASA